MSNVMFQALAQDAADSLRRELESAVGRPRVDVLNGLASYRKSVNPEEAEQFLHLSLKLADSLNYHEGKVKSWLVLATIASRQSDFFRADSLIGMSMNLTKEVDDQYGLTSALLAKGVLNIRRGRYDEAIQDHIEGVKVAREIAEGDLMQTHTMNIGHIKSRLNLPEEADKYFLESLEIAEAYGLTHRVGQVYLALGVSAYQRGDLAACIAYYERALPIFINEQELRSAGVVLNNLGYAYYLKKDFERANAYYDRSLEFRTQLNDRLGISRIWLNKARIKFNLGENREANRLSNVSLGIAREIKDLKREMEVLEFMVEVYEQEGNLNKALNTFRIYGDLKDSVNAIANQQRVAELTAEFELERKEKELDNARQQVSLLAEREGLLQTRQWLLTASVLLLLLVASFIWAFQKARVKRALANERLAEQRAKNEELMKKQLGHELMLKIEELKSHADRLASQNQLIQNFKDQLTEQDNKRENLIESDRIEDIVNYLERNADQYLTWQQFRLKFDESYPGFTASLIKDFPSMTPNELDISILLKINLPNKEVAQILNISYDGVKKSIHRLYKKMHLDSPEQLRRHVLKV